MRTVILFLLTFGYTHLFAQIPDYFEGNPKWCVNKRWIEYQGGCINYVDQVHYINGDTTINNTIYKKLYTRGVNQGCGLSPEPYNYLEEFLRQDGEKIYRYYSEIDSEHLLYDFSLGIGDTIPYGGINGDVPGDQVFPKQGDLHYIVDNIDSLYLQGSYFKKFYFSAIDSSSGIVISPITDNAISDSYIEGIGHQFGFIWQYYGIGEGESRGLFAFSKGDTLYYEFEENGGLFLCDFDVSIIEQKKEKAIFEIFPNPAYNKLNLKVSGNFQPRGFRIYSINGKVILENKLSFNTEYTINLEDLTSGIYLLEVESIDGFRQTQRFIVE